MRSATGLYFQRDELDGAGIANLLKRSHHRGLLRVNPLALLGILIEEYGRTCEILIHGLRRTTRCLPET